MQYESFEDQVCEVFQTNILLFPLYPHLSTILSMSEPRCKGRPYGHRKLFDSRCSVVRSEPFKTNSFTFCGVAWKNITLGFRISLLNYLRHYLLWAIKIVAGDTIILSHSKQVGNAVPQLAKNHFLISPKNMSRNFTVKNTLQTTMLQTSILQTSTLQTTTYWSMNENTRLNRKLWSVEFEHTNELYQSNSIKNHIAGYLQNQNR